MYQDSKENSGKFLFLLNEELFPNEFIIFKNGNSSIITRYLGNNMFKKVSDSVSSFKLQAKNKEQLMALDLLLDPEIKLVTLAGLAGSGKTICALAAGLEQTSLNPTSKNSGGKQYNSLVCMKPVISVGKEIGWLPGDLKEKMEPWMAPIKDNLRYLISQGKKDKNLEQTLSMYFENGIIEIEAMSFIRGRSIANAFIIIDETQNITHHEIKTILTRVGENTKIVLTGDISQIDNTQLSALNNGLSIIVEKFKEFSIAGHITLQKGERSELATIASNIL
jgi:PhoH-like ATPase